MPTAPLPPLGEDLGLMRAVWAVDQGLQSASKRLYQEFRITGRQRLVIRLVARFPGLTVSRLAALLHVHPSTVSEILDRLERSRLLSRRPDTRDGRRAYLGLTARGRALDLTTEHVLEVAVRQARGRLSRRQVDHARQVLLAIAQALAEAEARPLARRELPPSASAGAKRASTSRSSLRGSGRSR